MNERVVSWSFDPWRESPARALAAVVAALACAALPAFAGLPPLATIGLAVCGFGVFHDRLMPVRCRLDERGIERRVGPLAERRLWNEVRVARWNRGAVRLSRFRGDGLAAALRALELPLPRDGGAPLRDAVRDALGRHGL